MNKKLLPIFILLLSISFTGCGLIPSKGCTDPDSANYDPDADNDDGSCLYQGVITFWNGQAVSQYLLNNGVSSLIFYVDGFLVGSKAASVYFSSSPDCGQEGAVTATRDMGSSSSKEIYYEVEDGSGNVLWSGSLTLTAGFDCTRLQLTL